MKNTLISIFLILTFIECSSPGEQHDDHDEHEHKSSEIASDLVVLSADQVQATGITFGKAENKSLTGTIKANGLLELPPQNKAAISTYMGGLISRIYVIQGDQVKEGQTLALLDNPEIMQVQEKYITASNELDYAKNEYDRQKQLLDERIISAKKFQQAETDYNAKKAIVRSLENQLTLLGLSPASIKKGNIVKSIPLKTPIGGFIHKINVSTGSYVNPATEVFSVVDNHHVHIDLHVFEKDIDKVKVGQEVIFGFSEKGEKPYKAEVFAVGKAYDPETRSVSIHAEIRNNKNKSFIPGLYVHARILTDTNSVTALPEDAIINQGDLKYVFALSEIEKEDYKFKRIPVTTGLSDNGFVQINFLDKLKPEWKIVTSGAYYLKAKMNEGSGGHEH